MLSFLAAAALSIAVGLSLGIGRIPAQQRTAEQIFILTLTSDGAMLAVLLALARRIMGLRPADLGFRRPTAAALGRAVGVAALLWLVSIGVNLVQIQLVGPHPQSLLVTVGAHTGPVALGLDLLTGAVVAPVAEEALFRGLLFTGLARWMPVPAAAAVTALLFAASHGLGVIVPIFLLGLGLAYVYVRTGTLWASIATHATVNAVSLVLVFALPR